MIARHSLAQSYESYRQSDWSPSQLFFWDVTQRFPFWGERYVTSNKTSAKEAAVRVVLFLFCLLNSSSFCSVHPNVVRIHMSRKRGKRSFELVRFDSPSHFQGISLGVLKRSAISGIPCRLSPGYILQWGSV